MLGSVHFVNALHLAQTFASHDARQELTGADLVRGALAFHNLATLALSRLGVELSGLTDYLSGAVQIVPWLGVGELSAELAHGTPLTGSGRELLRKAELLATASDLAYVDVQHVVLAALEISHAGTYADVPSIAPTPEAFAAALSALIEDCSPQVVEVDALDIVLAVEAIRVREGEERLSSIYALYRAVYHASSNGNSTQGDDIQSILRSTSNQLARPDVVAALEIAATDSSVRVRSAVGWVISEADYSDELAGIVGGLLSDSNTSVRRAALGALNTWRVSEPLARLVGSALCDADSGVVSAACVIACRYKSDRLLEPVRAVLAHASPVARLAACVALMELDAADSLTLDVLKVLDRSSASKELNGNIEERYRVWQQRIAPGIVVKTRGLMSTGELISELQGILGDD